MTCRVSYQERSGIGFKATLIRCWERGEIDEPVMSASSGPKPYTRNHIWYIFDRFPLIARVLMMRGEYVRSLPFLLVENEAGEVWDMAGAPVVMNPNREVLQKGTK